MTKPSPKDISRLHILESTISHFDGKKSITRAESQIFDDYCRAAVRLYHGVVSKTPDAATVGEFSRFRRLAYRAMARLGGEGILPIFSLKDYDHIQYGPFLGVSDEGSAAAVIRKAALASPKVKALGLKDPLSVGVAVDAERLGGVGEVAVGPDEYINVRLECAGRILNSTNIGTRVNLRYYRRHPVVTMGEGDQEIEVEQARKDILEKFKPFLHALGGKPRSLTVYVEFGRKNLWGISRRASVLRDLSRYAAGPVVSDRKVHRLGYQAYIRSGFKGQSDALRAINIAVAAGFLDVAICGRVRQSAEVRVSDPGLLNYLAPGKLGPVLRHANKLGIHLRPVNTVDPDTVARHIWSALHTAWQMGFELGKYGLFPLTLEESEVVISHISCGSPIGPRLLYFSSTVAS